MSIKAVQSSYRDRTNEFLTVAEKLKKSISSTANGPSTASSKPEGPESAISLQKEFNKRASKIGFGIHQTSQKLSKLAQLAKRTSYYDDPTVEIQELTAVIKQDINALNNAVGDLQVLCNSQNGSGSISKDTTNHATTVVDNLKNRLMSTTKEFKDVLTMRTENLKVHENRRQLYTSGPSKDKSNPFVRQRPLAAKAANASTAPPLPWENSTSSSSQLFSRQFENNSCMFMLQKFKESKFRRQMNGEPSTPTGSSSQQQQQQMVAMQDTYMQSRADALQNVESTIHELSSIFTQLATMVSQQGELAIRIDENMDDTLANVEGAQGALLKYLNSISSNRWLMIKIFFVLIVFLMIFLFFVA
ncbi:Syntaxin [Nymphaea thermarum]|nr:Syntaxin [Nymphaea thermarum]